MLHSQEEPRRRSPRLELPQNAPHRQPERRNAPVLPDAIQRREAASLALTAAQRAVAGALDALRAAEETAQTTAGE
jgi:hypothetical protein